VTAGARAGVTAAAAMAVTLALAAACSTWRAPAVSAPLAEPLAYRAPYAKEPPAIGGSLEQGAWAGAPWTDDFVDIEGDRRPRPAYRTRAKMLWDERFLYVGAQLEEPHVWSSLREHDQIVFQDNDFEAFIDPDGDGREYYEIEINARGTVFDLFLHRSYRDGAPAIHEWDVGGAFARSIAFDGTPDDSRDVDRGWTVMLAIPWDAFVPPRDPRIDALPAGQRDFGDRARGGAAPRAGDTWRINFSRVQWRHNHERLDAAGARILPAAAGDGTPYAKRAGLPEDNWVWTPQWAVDMHLPQHWGRVTFEDRRP
jgi:hypothetical protein